MANVSNTESRRGRASVAVLSVALAIMTAVATFSIGVNISIANDRGLKVMREEVWELEYRIDGLENEFENHNDYSHVRHRDISQLERAMERYAETYRDRLGEQERRLGWLIRLLVFGGRD